jgi:hypothetical protein
MLVRSFLIFTILFQVWDGSSQVSVPHQWVNQNLNAIRKDRARPPIHARNLYHLSSGMYDAWAAYEPNVETYFLGKELNGFECAFDGVQIPDNQTERIAAQEKAISYFAYRLIKHRYLNAPGVYLIYQSLESQMLALNYETNFNSTNYQVDGPAALGNYLAQKWIEYGLVDGSNESGNYANQYYQPANPPILPLQSGNSSMIDPNRWQAISLPNAIDQAGNPVVGVPPFVAPEWGNVRPFAMDAAQLSLHDRDGDTYKVYNIPADPPLLDTNIQSGLEDFLKWNHILVSVWQSHLDPNDGVLWDISPNSIGNITSYPQNWSEYDDFYNLIDGGDIGTGYSVNPVTGLPYQPQMVKRGDYTRVLAEFWADGLDSETPPGHWYEIYNHVRIHPLFVNQWKGVGPILSELEYDVKSYLSLGGAMHDAAISAWSIKGWFDTPRPVSMIRYMAGKGQSTDNLLPNYHPAGLPIIPGHIEVVLSGDPLAGVLDENVGKLKLYTWKGPSYITDPNTDIAGVDWILAENWWPYQRPTFVTPPFAGYVSGHSTFSNAAANVMTFITGTPYFPGGMSEFVANQNDFLEFEVGPSETVVLQWATYKDAADQCSLSRLWGGIHPPFDDIPGRQIGTIVGTEAATMADSIFSIDLPTNSLLISQSLINESHLGQNFEITLNYDHVMNTGVEPLVTFLIDNSDNSALTFVSGNWNDADTYTSTYLIDGANLELNNFKVKISGGESADNKLQNNRIFDLSLEYDTRKPLMDSVIANFAIINSLSLQQELIVDWYLNEPCQNINPSVQLDQFVDGNLTISYNAISSQWVNNQHYRSYHSIDQIDQIEGNIVLQLQGVLDVLGNSNELVSSTISVDVDSKMPQIVSDIANLSQLNVFNTGGNSYNLNLTFNKLMNTSNIPSIEFSYNGIILQPLTMNQNSSWLDANNLNLFFDLESAPTQEIYGINLLLNEVQDQSGNILLNYPLLSQLDIDTRKPEIISAIPSHYLINDQVINDNSFQIVMDYSELMRTDFKPIVSFYQGVNPVIEISYNIFDSYWTDTNTFVALFDFPENTLDLVGLNFRVISAMDSLANAQEIFWFNDLINVSYDISSNAISELGWNMNFKIYPNPIQNGNDLIIENQNEKGIFMSMLDPTGRLVISESSCIDKNCKLSINVLSSGVYYLNLRTEEGLVYTEKIIVYE